MKTGAHILGLLGALVVVSVVLLAAEIRPGYFSNVTYLAGLLLLEIVLVTIWHYERFFFPVLMFTFLWAGTDIPFSNVGNGARWVFLSVGAVVGVVKWASRVGRPSMTAIHLVASLCVLSGAVSAMVSSHIQTSLLKAASLFLLFLYGAFGVRVAVADRHAAFFRGLLTACEVTSYVSGVAYVLLRFELFGNPNSLGAVMGVVVVPVLFWGVLIADDRRVRQRRTLALGVALYLLYSSISRASILATIVAITVACVVLQRERLLVKAAFGLVFMVAIIATIQPAQFDALVSSFTEDVVYKGHKDEGLLGSRRDPWQDTVNVIKGSPWFGSGFGTSPKDQQDVGADSMIHTMNESNREHGSSYLALLDYVGLLGIVPFAILLTFVLRLIYGVCSWTRRTGTPHHYAFPLALICLAGLVHAFFEDWLFAVGYYLSVFFWTSVFLLSDIQPTSPRKSAVSSSDWQKSDLGPRQSPLSLHQ